MRKISFWLVVVRQAAKKSWYSQLAVLSDKSIVSVVLIKGLATDSFSAQLRVNPKLKVLL